MQSHETSITFTALQIVVPALVAFFVVALSHRLTTSRDELNKRREQRIDYLVSVFRALSKANHHPKLYEVADEVEQAIADIQLFGTPEQVRLAQQFAKELGTNQTAELNPLLISIRDDLRSALRAPAIPERLVWLRIGRLQKDVDNP
jgi:hypothetical protein